MQREIKGGSTGDCTILGSLQSKTAERGREMNCTSVLSLTLKARNMYYYNILQIMHTISFNYL